MRTSRSRRCLWTAGVAATAMILAACSGGSTSKTIAGSGSSSGPTVGASSTKDPCKIASQADVTAAFGGTVGPGIPGDTPVGRQCKFSITASNLGLDGSAVIRVDPSQSKSTFDLAKTEIPQVVSVEGVGDDAYYNPTVEALELLKGRSAVSVQALFFPTGGTSVDAAKVKADVIALGKVAAGNV